MEKEKEKERERDLFLQIFFLFSIEPNILALLCMKANKLVCISAGILFVFLSG
jgi:hypothetical protein